MIVFGFWLMAGVAIGMILMAFLAIGTYERGYREGYLLRKPWRAELGARRRAFEKAYLRERAVVREEAVAASTRMPAPSRVAVSRRAASSSG